MLEIRTKTLADTPYISNLNAQRLSSREMIEAQLGHLLRCLHSSTAVLKGAQLVLGLTDRARTHGYHGGISNHQIGVNVGFLSSSLTHHATVNILTLRLHEDTMWGCLKLRCGE